MKIVTRQKTVVQEYNVYIAEDGKEFKTYDECKDYDERRKGNRSTCPDCGGKGYHQGKWIDSYDNYDIGHVEGHYETHTCKKCGGKGYLEKKVTWE